MIGIGYCTKQSDKKIDDSNYINNMLMPGQENNENESWGNFKGILYPCVGFRSQGGSVKVNFSNENFKYYAMTNEDINEKSKNALILEYQEKVYFIIGEYENMLVSLITNLTKSLEKEPNNAFELSYRGKLYFIMGKYYEAFEDLTKLLEIEPNNTIALRYKSEINYIMKRYNESIADLEELLRIKPND
ncbi:hypothetical protein C2G38_2110272, partial [Gigaspora rosea]